ncbi:hypothetical protein [Devosia sp.]|uniref:hypothetical protein n=1 Tax=Devosia sp. TaxID=1871048 RepID=UPI0034449005
MDRRASGDRIGRCPAVVEDVVPTTVLLDGQRSVDAHDGRRRPNGRIPTHIPGANADDNDLVAGVDIVGENIALRPAVSRHTGASFDNRIPAVVIIGGSRWISHHWRQLRDGLHIPCEGKQLNTGDRIDPAAIPGPDRDDPVRHVDDVVVAIPVQIERVDICSALDPVVAALCIKRTKGGDDHGHHGRVAQGSGLALAT